MSLIDRLRDCNNANLRTVRPLLHEGATIGWVDPDFACRLTAKPDVFSVCRDKIIIASSGLGYRALSDKINLALREIYDDDQSGFGKWCNEMSPVAAQIGHAPLFEVERCAVGPLGVLTRGVHLNGFVRANGAISMWIAQRANHIAAQPGKLDQIVGGFLPAGGDPVKQLTEEAGEEAGIHADMLRGMAPVGAINFCMKVPLGVKRGRCLIFDLEMPDHFTPVNKDAEVEKFSLMPPEKVIEILENGQKFKFDCALIAIDFLIRHKEIASSHPSYHELLKGLRG